VVTKTFCDAPGCKEEVYGEDPVDVCSGFMTRREQPGKPPEDFEPFEKGVTIRKLDLCPKHRKLWCKATYYAFFGDPKDAQY
jgi:hypothetical protein